jgi:hypothetical protein
MPSHVSLAGSVPSPLSLEQLSDAELLDSTRRFVGHSNQMLAELLLHLGEVEERGIHRARACSSLYTYCIYELRFSEDEAFRRVAAARLVRRFPALFDAVASGELHLTGLLLLGPHLTEANLVEVLARAKHRTKREIARLVRLLDPLPAVLARIEPLGPAPARVIPAAPSWEEYVQSMNPMRELAPGERPRDWAEGANDTSCGAFGVNDARLAAPARVGSASDPTDGIVPGLEQAPAPPHGPSTAPRWPGTETRGGGLEPVQYKVQFTASEEYVRLVDQAKALLSHAVPGVTLEELQLRAMRSLVSELSKTKYAALSGSPERHGAAEAAHAKTDPDAPEPRANEPAVPDPASEVEDEDEDSHEHGSEGRNPRQRGRYIPAGVRRTVFSRDGARCSYVDAAERRCVETHRLEFHHVVPFAEGGEHTASNITLRCAAHNALAAEAHFGRDLVESKKASIAHESFRRSSRI